MNLEQFERDVDAAESPREHVKRITRNIVSSTLANVPPDVAESIASGPLQSLARDAAVCFLRGRYDALDALLSRFSSELGSALQWEQTHGSLHVTGPDEEIERTASQLGAHLWNGLEVDCLRQLLQHGETIQSVGWHEVVTSQRKISREACLQFRPVSVTEDGWRRMLTSEDKIRFGLMGEQRRVEAEEGSRHPWAWGRGTGRM